jgi:hypothetical protein
MTLITKALTEQLLANGRAQRAAMDKGDDALNFKPVVKLFTPDAQCTWLLTELGLPIERDLHFVAEKSISAYAAEARALRRVVA